LARTPVNLLKEVERSLAFDGRVESSGAVFEAKFMLPWSFSEEAAAAKYMPLAAT
jgi:hypothetical protein